MAFDSLAPQPPIWPEEAEIYARDALAYSRRAAASVDVTMDVAYGPEPGQKLDIYRPDGAASGGLPVLIFAHGGAWTHGYKEWMGLMAPTILATPAIFVSIDYRLSPGHRYPDQAEDCVAALAWVIANIADHGGDPKRVFVGGHSAGGHLYALVSLRDDLLRAGGVAPDAIRACLAVSGQMDMRFKKIEPGSGEQRIHDVFLRTPADAEPASPAAFVARRQVPMLLAVGSDDFPRIVRSNRAMAKALRAHGGTAELMILQNYGHFDTALEPRKPDNRWVKRARTWLRR
jgi:arylformamidase